MASFQLRQLESADQLCAVATAWDDLWSRSETTIPTVRAELVALWVETFAPAATFRALVVEDDDEMVAALPLVDTRKGRIICCGGLTSNYWSPNGNLLLDPKTDVDRVMSLLVDGIESLGWPLLWFDMVPVATTAWKAFLQEFRQRGLPVDVHQRWEVGRIELGNDFDAYFASRSKNLRRSLRKDTRHLEEKAPLELYLEDRFTPELVESRLDEIFAIENSGWKGEAGSSVLCHSNALDFYRRQAQRLAEWNLLRVARLRHGDRTVAFDLGWVGNDTYHSYKIGYDPEYRPFGPGHLLRERQVRELAARNDVHAIDFQGPMTQALRAWATDKYPIARVVAAQRRLGGRTLFAAYRTAAKVVRAVRKQPSP